MSDKEKADQKAWEKANNIQTFDASFYQYDSEQQDNLREKKPWNQDPVYFKQVKISAVALLKMLLHSVDGLAKTRKDEDLEVMGLLQGKIDGDAIIVMDCFGVSMGSEIRVNASTADYEFMVQYKECAERVGKEESVVGWYHSHPGFGCWLSGIDVKTESNNQKYQDPYIAIVVDPKRTLASGKVEIGCFRCWPDRADFIPPEAYKLKPPKGGKGDFDYGVFCDKYYQLKHSVFKSSLDAKLLELLWSKYWVKTLSVSRNAMNRDYNTVELAGLNDKLADAEKNLDRHRGMHGGGKKGEESDLALASKECSNAAIEQLHGVMNQLIKHQLFNMERKG